MRANVEHNNTLHRNVVILSIETLNVPNVPEAEQVDIDDLGYRDDGISHVTARLGFQDDVDVAAAARAGDRQGLEGDCDVAHRLLLPLAHDDRRDRRRPGMRRWRKKLFMALARNAANPVAYFGLPDDRTVVMGSHVTF